MSATGAVQPMVPRQPTRTRAQPTATAAMQSTVPAAQAGTPGTIADLPPLRVAVVTPCYKEPDEWLARCIDSVAAQTYPCTQILVGDGVQRQVANSDRLLHLSLPRGVADFGDTPRAVGGLYAAGLGFDAITYLDADNWYHRTHIETMMRAAAQSRAAIVTCRREFRHMTDGRFLVECATSDGEQFCDTSCLLLTRAAFDLLPVWALMDPAFHVLDDRVMWHHVRASGLPRAHTGLGTVAYLASHAGVYRDLGIEAPAGTKRVTGVNPALALWRERGLPDLTVRWGYRRAPSNPDRDW